MATVEEIQQVPTTTSVVPNQYLAHPNGPVLIRDQDSSGGDPSMARNSGAHGTGPGLSESGEPKVTDDKPTPEPPPVVKPESRTTASKSLGVVNGIAINLPKPLYPPPAIAMNIQGKVDVQVTIDETGKVISAKAASGHPLLRPAAEKAAWSARFSPTLLSKIPVKVTGVIVYNFTR